jgi:hypothetical protein
MKFIEEHVATVKSKKGRGEHGTETVTMYKLTTGGNNVQQLSIRIGKEIMRKARWMSGDRVLLAFGRVDGVDGFVLRRSPDGYTLSSGKTKKGECVTCHLKMTADKRIIELSRPFVARAFLPTIDGDTNSVVVTVKDELSAV